MDGSMNQRAMTRARRWSLLRNPNIFARIRKFGIDESKLFNKEMLATIATIFYLR